MSATPRHRRPAPPEPALGRSLAETQRLNDPRQQAARDAAEAVRRRAAERRQVRPGRRLTVAVAGMLALIGAIAALLRLLEG